MNKQDIYIVAEHAFRLIMSEDDFRWKMMEGTCVPFEKKGDNGPLGISEPTLFEYYEFGKPSLAIYPHLQFNMIHCKRAVACLLANHPAGINFEISHKHNYSHIYENRN